MDHLNKMSDTSLASVDKKMPRVVNQERLNRLYASFSIPELLAANGVADDQLAPAVVVHPPTRFNLPGLYRGHFTPLRLYDNTEYDIRRADEWVRRVRGVPTPAPAVVYAPAADGAHRWTAATIVDYDAAAATYTGHADGDVHAGLHRLQVHFTGEDPRVFVERIKYAFLRRDYAEKTMLWYMFMDKINIDDIPDRLSDETVNKILTLVFNIRKMHVEFAFKKKFSYLRHAVENTVLNYTSLIEKSCTMTKDIKADFTWGSDLCKSPFEGYSPPLFSIILTMNSNGPFYSPDVDEFEPTVVRLLMSSVMQSHEIPPIHPMLLTNIKFVNPGNLVSIGLLDEKIVGSQTIIENCIRSAVIPLKTYCERFYIYLPLFNTDIKSYVQNFFDGNPSVSRVKEEILIQLKFKSKLKYAIPDTIIIGLFMVNIKALKLSLIEKRDDLANSLMKHYASKTSEQLETYCAEYKRIYLKLNESPVSIEQVFEIREWIDTLPNIVQTKSEYVKNVILEMEMLDTFFWIINSEQLKLKVNANIWPYKIEMKIKESEENVSIDIEKFEKIQYEDELLLQNKIEYITNNILKLTIENNLSKVFEIAVEVNKMWKLIEELELFSQTLNRRQKLFGYQVVVYDNVQQLVEEFKPYKELWEAAAEFLKMQSTWLQNPLINIDGSSLEHLLNSCLNTMINCIEWFAEVPGTLSVAVEMKAQIEEFKPMMELLKDILNPGMRQRHWDSFALETGVQIILSTSLTFKTCLEMGINKHADVLKKIAETASKEYTIELDINLIERYWENSKLQITPYEDTFIMKMPDEDIQMLDNHILINQRLFQNPFKGILEEQLDQWDKNLTLIKNIVETWNEVQNKWIDLKPLFSDPDIVDQLPEENVKFVRVDRTWRRIMKMAANKPWVLTICLDKQLFSTLMYANNQLRSLEKIVAIKLAPKESSVISI